MAPLTRAFLETPLGVMLAFSSGRGLVALEFVSPQRLTRLDVRLKRYFDPFAFEDGTNDFIEQARAWLSSYFGDVPCDPVTLDLQGTDFERRVWHALLQVAPGSTRTYGEIARELGAPNGARAVGLAVGSNPIALIVPCHRIVGSTGSLTGYGGGLHRKRWLLGHESRHTNLVFDFEAANG